MNTREKPEPSTCLTLRLGFWPLGISVFWLASCLPPRAASALANKPVLSWEGIWFQWHWKRIAVSIQRKGTVRSSLLLSESAHWIQSSQLTCLLLTLGYVGGESRIFSLPDLAKPGPSRECPKVDGSLSHSCWAIPAEETTFRAVSQHRLSQSSGLKFSCWSYTTLFRNIFHAL